MKVNIDISAEYSEPFAVIYTDKVTDEIRRMVDLFNNSGTLLLKLKNGDKDYVSIKNLPEFKKYLGL